VRLGVLDVGSNTVHLLVVDALRGGHPMPTHSEKAVLRLAELVSPAGRLSRKGADSLVTAVAQAAAAARRLGCADLLAFATSAVREAENASDVLDRVRTETGVNLQVLSGIAEARLTFLAVRRWFGWSAGQLLVLDIGGGSLEIGCGIDEAPSFAESIPLGAGRLARERFDGDPPSKACLAALREHIDDRLASVVAQLSDAVRPDRVAATSKTFRSLARLTGAAPSSAGPRAPRVLTIDGLRQVIGFISRMSSTDLAELDGVSPARAHQLLAGAVVAESVMRLVAVDHVEICPWALREGIILRRLDWLDGA
jgi:exopolyphosphatase / guanosine-5'-triphosphate,3'-diphosphate pyrophosphatase